MNTELKRCPRCGRGALVYCYIAVPAEVADENAPGAAPSVMEYYVKCAHCIGENTPLFKKSGDAIKRWNNIVAARKI